MSLKNSQLLLLDALVYYAELSDNNIPLDEDNNENLNETEESIVTIGRLINSISRYETVFDGALGYSDKELGMNKIINLVSQDADLTKLVIVYPNKENDKSTSSICLVDPKTSEVYVIYVGNYAEEEYRYYDDDYNSTLIKTWVDNVMGAVEADTDEQKRELDFYEDAIAAAREYLHNQDGDLDITVSGHSAGGNHAQYVTIAYEDSMGENYQAINEIDRCVSFDGQGFSTAFLEKYKDDIAKNAGKITSYCPTVSIVGALMNDIPGIEQIFINIGEPDARLIGYHMLAELIDENGNFKKTGVPSLEYLLLKTFSTSSIEILEQLPGIDEYHAAEIIGEIIAKIMNDGCLDQDDLNSIISDKDSLALLGILVTKALPLAFVTAAVPELVAIAVPVDEINDAIAEMQELAKKGDVGQAIEKGCESFSKIAVALKMFGMGMETGHPIVGLAGFVTGWILGDSVFEMGSYVGGKIENTIETCWDFVKEFLGLNEYSFQKAFSRRAYVADPLVVDLDHDGFELTTVEDGVYFDNNNSGLSEKTQWVSPDDGILALDLNGDGFINDGSELFGTSTVLQDGTLAKSGFEALSQYDENGDGIIDEQDSIYSKLLIWQDKNSNGISEEDELTYLKDIGITSISLQAEVEDGVNTSGIQYQDGTTTKVGEFLFDAQLYNTIEKETIEITEEIEKLPNIGAIGNVASLHTLMQSDNTGTLVEYVNAFASSTDDTEKEALLTNILYFITGADNVPDGSRGSNFDAKKLAVIEAFMGHDFVGTEGANPVNAAAPELEKIYTNIFELYYNLLNGETALKDYLAMTFVAEKADGKKYIDTTIFDTFMNVCNEKGMDVKGIVKDMGRYLCSINNGNPDNFTQFLLHYGSNLELLTELKQISSINLVIGTGDDDSLNGGNTDNILIGGDGNDVLNGGAGNDTYCFNLGDGEDIIFDDESSQNADRIVFGEGIKAEDVYMERSGNDLIIRYSEEDKITIQNAYAYKSYYGNGCYFVESISFADGTVWDTEEIGRQASSYIGTDGDDTMVNYGSIVGYNQNEIYHAGAGNDTIYAGAGDDTLYGESGNDILNGSIGNDTYCFNLGDGEDVIYDEESYLNADKIVFGEGIKAEDIYMERSGDDLVIRYSEEDKVTIKNAYAYKSYYGYGYYFVESVSFADGTVWDTAEIGRQASSYIGTDGDDTMVNYGSIVGYNQNETYHAGAGNDTIHAGNGDDSLYGEEGNDVLNAGNGADNLTGGTGNDILYGETENDTYYFNLGDGEDIIFDDESSQNADRIVFGEGIKAEDVYMERSGNDLIIRYSEEDKITIQNAYAYKSYYGNGCYYVEEIEFEGVSKYNINYSDKTMEFVESMASLAVQEMSETVSDNVVDIINNIETINNNDNVQLWTAN